MSSSKKFSRKIAWGKVNRPHGVHGALKITPFNLDSTLLSEITTVFLGQSAEDSIQYAIKNVRQAHEFWIVKLEGLGNRNLVEGMQNLTVWINADDLPALEDGEYYLFELEGAHVLDHEGSSVGEVTTVVTTKAGNLIEVKTPKSTVLIPLIDDAVAEVDLETHTVRLKNMEGLLDDAV